jgi:PAS domain S-box-containing protein
MCFPGDATSFKELYIDAVSKKIKFETKARLRSESGIFKWFQIAGSPIIDGNGDLLNYFGICIDIDSNEKSSKEMEILPENLPQMIWKINNEGNVLYANSKFKKFIGAPPGTVLNVFDKNVLHPDDYSASVKAFEKGKTEKKSFQVLRQLKSFDGNFYKFKTKVFAGSHNREFLYLTMLKILCLGMELVRKKRNRFRLKNRISALNIRLLLKFIPKTTSQEAPDPRISIETFHGMLSIFSIHPSVHKSICKPQS